MKSAFHRSITFWSGILAMTFICWAWWGSMRTCVTIGYGDRQLRHCGSGIRADYIARLGMPGWRFSMEDVADLQPGLDRLRAG